MKMTLVSICILFSLLVWCACTDNYSYRETPEVKSVFINGDSIHYIDVGKGDPVVFVHGSLGDFRTWGEQIIAFSKNHRVISYSRRYAYPNKQVINDSADYTTTLHAKDLVEFIKALNLEPVHLVGHSYGGLTSLLTTIDHPELVRSLTLGEPPVVSLLNNVPGGDSLLYDYVAKVVVPAGIAFKVSNNKAAAALFYNFLWNDSSSFALLPIQDREIMLDNTLEVRGGVFAKDLFPLVTCDDLQKIKVPVLLMKGDRSTVLMKSIIKELDRCISNKENVTLPNAAHGLQIDNPVEFNKTVLGFLDKLE